LVKRKTNSPWGSAYKEGLPSTAVNDRVVVDELLYPSVNTGVIDVATGQWEGITTSDKTFTIDAIHESVANGAAVLSPQATPDYIDMTGFCDIAIAIKPSNGGNLAISAVMGPDSNAYANLSPVNAATSLRGTSAAQNDMNPLFNDTSESCAAGVWNIFILQERMSNQKLLQFKLTNNSGGVSNIEFAYMRLKDG
jgi:hypothetical protein